MNWDEDWIFYYKIINIAKLWVKRLCIPLIKQQDTHLQGVKRDICYPVSRFEGIKRKLRIFIDKKILYKYNLIKYSGANSLKEKIKACIGSIYPYSLITNGISYLLPEDIGLSPQMFFSNFGIIPPNFLSKICNDLTIKYIKINNNFLFFRDPYILESLNIKVKNFKPKCVRDLIQKYNII